MKILIDMNMSPLWVPFFAGHGIEAAHWANIGRATASDEVIFTYAAANGFAVFTHDLDFGTLLAVRGTKTPSVIQVRMHDVMPSGPCGAAVLNTIRQAGASLERGALVTIDVSRGRIRLLPI